MATWCSGQTYLPLKEKNAGSNPVVALSRNTKLNLYLCISPFEAYLGLGFSNVLIIESQNPDSAMQIAHELTFRDDEVTFENAEWESYLIDSFGTCRLKFQFENR